MVKLTERAKKVLNLAYYEAKSRNHTGITCENILLGMLHEGKGIGAKVLQDAGITLELAQERFHLVPVDAALSTPKHNFWRRWSGRLGLGQEARDWDALGLSVDARACLERAAIAAQRFGHNYIGTEHLLLGLLESGNARVMLILRDYNIDAWKVEQSMHRRLAKQRG